MGRHGGGSRSGGSRGRSGGSSRGGSRSGSGYTTSNRPFIGAYNRSYYHRGRLRSYYTTDASFGTKKGWNIGIILILVFICMHMCIMFAGFFETVVEHGEKIDGSKEFIEIIDNMDILSPEDEKNILVTLNKVYDKSGMPIMLYTTDYKYKNRYHSIEAYSEDLYYSRTLEENCMVILITFDLRPEFMDWNYDMYCGDDTIKCLSDAEFDKVLNHFQKAMYQMDIPYAVEYAWDSVMDDIGRTNINVSGLFILPFLLSIYGVFIVAIVGAVKNKNDAYKYFKEHPEKLNNTVYSQNSEFSSSTEMAHDIKCKNCGVDNLSTDKTCRFCGKDLT